MKKRALTIIAVLAAVSMLSVAVFAGGTPYAGYERFKDLLRNNEMEEMHSGEGSVVLIDNNKEVLSVNGTFVGTEDKNGSGIFTIKSETVEKTLEVYGQDSTMLIVDGNDVYRKTHDEQYEKPQSRKDMDKDFDQRSEAFLDFVLNDFKDDFSLEGDDVVFELTKEEMPAFLNLMTSDVDRDNHKDFEHADLTGYPLFTELQSLKDVMPELEETSIEYIKVTLKVENNQVVGMAMNLEVKGTDTNGEEHHLKVVADFNKLMEEQTVKTFEITNQNVFDLPNEDHR